MTTTFNHVAISCKDPVATERFYSKHFGFERARVIPLGDDQIVFLRAGDTYLELFSAEGERPGPAADADGPHTPGWRHIAFKVDSVDDTLAAMGGDAKITLGPMDFDAFIPVGAPSGSPIRRVGLSRSAKVLWMRTIRPP